MKLVTLLAITLSSVSFMSNASSDKDASLIKEMEMKEALVSKPRPQHSLNAISVDEIQQSQSRLLKVLLKERGTAAQIAQELGVTLISGGKQKAVSFKVDAHDSVDDIVAELRSHTGVIKVKREVLVNKYEPK